MTYKVVPEVATDEMKQAAIWACDYRIGGDAAENAFRPENLEDKCPIQAAIAAAPDTGMIAVDKVKFEALKALSKDLINKFENCLITNGTDPEFAAIATNKYWQALKNTGGSDESK